MLATGSSCFELDYKIDRAAVRAATRGRATVIGTLDPAFLLAAATPAQVQAKAVEDIGIMAPGGRFILGAGCTVPRDTPPENVRALVNAAREHGHYAADGSLDCG
jgi:uroporphyrinogen-III decarboxylase